MLRSFIVMGALTVFSWGWASPSLASDVSSPSIRTNRPLPMPKNQAGSVGLKTANTPSPTASQESVAISDHSKTERTSPSCLLEATKSPVVVLSIDGASVRGIAQFELLLAIEEKVNEALAKEALANAKGKKITYERESITDMFDFFAGTSAGSVNVGGLLIPSDYALANTSEGNKSGRPVNPKFTLDQLQSMLPDTLRAAFSSSTFRKFRTLQIPGAGGLLGSKFTAGPFEELLKGLGGQARISDLVKPAVITSYDLRGREIMNFSTNEACSINPEEDVIQFQSPDNNDFFRKDKNVFIWQAIRASSAAPVFYKPLQVEIGGKQRALIDAGLFVMSPTLLAWIEAQKVYPGRPIIIISISSGNLLEARVVDTEGATAGSIPKVLQPTIETALEGQQALTDLMMRDLPGIQYYRLSFDVKNKQFDDTSEKNIKALKDAAKVTIASLEFKKAIKAIADARRERKEKNDLKPYICKAKERLRKNQKSLIPARKINAEAGITEEDIKNKMQKAYEEVNKQIQPLKASCQNLLNQNQTATSQWKDSNCDKVVSPKEVCQGLSVQKQTRTREWKNRNCQKVMN